MPWYHLDPCTLQIKLRSGELTHPTSVDFDGDRWSAELSALEEAGNVSERDYAIAAAALYFGREISSLRTYVGDGFVRGFSRERAIRLLAAVANQQFLTLQRKVAEKARKASKRGQVHLEELNQELIRSAYGQDFNAADLNTSLVDSLPNWLFHIRAIAPDVASSEPPEPLQFGARALTFASIEHSLRDLWQGALWSKRQLEWIDDQLADVPADEELAALWFVWDMRQTALASWEHQMDAGASVVARKRLPPIMPLLERTVVRLKRGPDGRRKYVLGKPSGSDPWQRGHVSENDMLERLYTGLFMDETLPTHGHHNLTCREICKAWWVLSDLARLVMSDLGNPWISDDRGMGKFAFPIDLKTVVGLFSDCLSITKEKALLIANTLTCDVDNTQSLFRRGVWSSPLFPTDGGDRLYLILAPLIAGSPIKRVEAWMEAGGISDTSGVKGRGNPFENHVRSELSNALSRNSVLKDCSIYPHALKRKGNSEEIDLLIRVGRIIIVGEVKCFIAPSEGIEQHNYLKSLSKATTQADNKVRWAAENRGAIAELFHINDEDQINKLEFVPVVVINQGFGLGLSKNDVPIVDMHYMRLLLGCKEYQAETWFEADVGMTYNLVPLYRDQNAFENDIRELLDEPVPLKRYFEVIGWRMLPFQTSSGEPFSIKIPTLIAAPVN